MAIVKTFHVGNATVHIDDTYYRDATPQEIARRRKVFDEVAGGILYRKQLRELEKEKEGPAG